MPLRRSPPRPPVAAAPAGCLNERAMAVVVRGAEAMRRADVLIVEDDDAICAMLTAALEGEGCAVRTCGTGGDALRATLAHRPDVILLDWRLPDMDGGEFARRYREAVADPAPLVLLSGLTDMSRYAAEEDVRPVAVLPKPFDLDELLAVLRRFTDCLN